MTNETICEMLDEEPRPLHSAAAESIRSLMRHAERAQTVWEKMRDELAQAKAELAQARAKNDACSTCVGSGVMSVLREVLPPDEREVYADEQCAECEGTGIGYVGKLERELAQVKADWRKVYALQRHVEGELKADPRRQR